MRKNKLDWRTRSFVERDLENYHRLKSEVAAYKDCIIYESAGLSDGVPHGTEISKPTEQKAIRLATDDYLLHSEKVIRSIDYVLSKCDETDLTIIKYSYWHKYSAEAVAEKAFCHRKTVWQRKQKILYMLACTLGYIAA